MTDSEKFREQGYFILDLNLTDDFIQSLLHDVNQLYAPDYHNDKPYKIQDMFKNTILKKILRNRFKPTPYDKIIRYSTRVQDAWHVVEQVKQLALNQQILAKLEELYHAKPLPFQTLNFSVGTEQATHSDTIHFNCYPPGFMAGVWIAFEDMDEENGPLMYYPGSHQLKEFTMQDFGLKPQSDQYIHYENKMREIVKENQLRLAYGMIKKGQALIWSSNLLHGGSSIKNKERTRHSQVVHYFFSGSEYYYTPMLSAPKRPHLRQPEWIE